MFKCCLFSLFISRTTFRVPGIFYLNLPDHTLGEELFFFCSDNLQLFPISNVQIPPSIKFSQIHNYLAKQNTKRPETLAGKGMKVKAMFE